ncbi:hypothetical protein [Flavihumibacter sp. CACIAM 22H1]|uniref:hypothetical protein n=1 Tax=Flavihumibacter sp. CACIAM 22H1 TaxID=1812911 RepID=UPI000A70E837|nr:hypothetical protein [Flavihumibacter sp. CACIAM 22H1]
MRSFLYSGLIALAVSFVSCTKNSSEPANTNELAGLTLVKTIRNTTHSIDLYSATGKVQTGYNEIFLQLKTADGKLVSDAELSWMPVMKMMGMSHSCPFGAVQKKEPFKQTYSGFIIFQMAGNDMEYWELSIQYAVNGTAYSMTDRIAVTDPSRRTVQSFLGADNKRYVLAMVEPVVPKTALNDISARLYTMSSMMQFDPVDSYTIQLDPRMPGMGNHGSPNNVHLTQSADKIYRGKLSLTMTGYWKINLRLLDATGSVVKGEPVTGDNTSSSLFFELEF